MLNSERMFRRSPLSPSSDRDHQGQGRTSRSLKLSFLVQIKHNLSSEKILAPLFSVKAPNLTHEKTFHTYTIEVAELFLSLS